MTSPAVGTYNLYVDWSGDGNFSSIHDDITYDVEDIRFRRGRDTLMGKATAGTMEVKLKNDTNRFTPANVCSPIYGYAGGIFLGREAKLTMTYGGTTVTKFVGKIARLVPHDRWDDQYAYLYCVDDTPILNRGEVSSVLIESMETGKVVNLLLEEAGWPVSKVDMVGLWPLDGDAKDYSGRGNDLTENGSPTYSTGKILQGILLDGATQWLNVADDPAQNFGSDTDITLSCWIKSTDKDATEAGVISHRTGSTGYQIRRTASAGTINLWIGDGANTATVACSTDVCDGDWHHVVARFDRDGNGQIYIDGAYETQVRIASVGDCDASTPFEVGRQLENSANCFGGMIDDVRAYSRLLSAKEIIDLAAVRKSLDTGEDTIPLAYWHQISALSAIQEVEAHEVGMFYFDRQGFATFESRYNRAARTSSDECEEDMLDYPYDINDANIWNEVRATYTEKVLGGTQELWRLQDMPNLPAGQTRTFWGDFSAISKNVLAPVATTDYTANTAENGSGTDLTASFSVVVAIFSRSIMVQVTNNAAVAGYLTMMKARGDPYADGDTTTCKSEDLVSQQFYGKRVKNLDGKFLGDADQAQDFCDFVCSKLKDPHSQIPMPLVNRDAGNMAMIRDIDVSDRITVSCVVAAYMTAEEFYVDKVEHHIYEGMQVHECTFLLTAAELEEWWILDVSEMDSGTRFGY